MEVDLRDATTLVNATFEDMGSAHNNLVKGLEKDARLQTSAWIKFARTQITIAEL